MRILSPKVRAAAEVVLTLAVLAFVAYDLVGRSEKPSNDPVFPRTAPSEALSATTSKASTRFQPQVAASVTTLQQVCGPTVALATPLNVASGQALIFYGNNNCPTNPVLMANSNTTYGSASILSGGWLSLQNVFTPMLTGAMGALAMASGSYLELIIPVYPSFVPNSFTTVTLNVLVAAGAPCPSFTGVNINITGCPVDTSITTGTYACSLSTQSDVASCTLQLTIIGAQSQQSSQYAKIVMGLDCSTLTQATFKLKIQAATGISASSILITYWQCGSITAIVAILGGTPAEANAALAALAAALLPGSPLATTLSLLQPVVLTLDPTVVTNYTFNYTGIVYPYSYPYVLPFLVPYSSSNPGLLALLTLLIIPVGIGLAALFWCACRRRCACACPCPMPCPCPSPCAMPLMAATTCGPCGY